MKVYLNIGTNLGDKEQNIESAISMIESAFGIVARRSDVIESEAWGFESTNTFLNIGISFDTQIDAMSILKIIKQIEREMGCFTHRTTKGEYADRIIDIDIMDVEGVVLESELLNIPHIHLHDREFFIKPYLQLKSMN
ncbi:MAG: 2-amino-4-hydroxy-6-hydroxymethyldihydropteridine diphosphokinase [Muribaculaceae bacterium]|nr:2-amino-4-hydroxy-6-hydroxymethyldihydropteridine diphosphokinase [Muribaculaceae bacterium]